jgi:hypothetical protein
MMALLTVGFFGIVTSGDMVQRQVEYNSDHTSLIAEAKLKADAYEERMSRELLYTSNTEALRLGNEEGGLNWEYNVPKYQELKAKYLEDVGSELRTQNDVLGCSNPSIDDISANSTRNWYSVTLSNHWITCTSEPIGEENFQPTEATVNISPRFSITHNDNRYLKMANYSSVVTGNATSILEKRLPEPPTDTGKASYCDYPGTLESEVEESTRRGARYRARDNLLSSGLYGIAEEAWNEKDSQRPSFLETLEKNTLWPDVDQLTHFVYLGETVEDDSGSCGYDPCDSDDEDCNEPTEYADKHTFEYRYVPDWVDFEYHFEDSEERIINSEARLERLDFEFTHRHEVN